MKKNNQSKQYFSYKNDDNELVELGQFIRDTTNYKVVREWFLVFENGKYIGYQKWIAENPRYVIKNPDLMLLNKKTGELKMIIEVDGDVHRVKEMDTEQRNELYKNSGLPLLVINKWQIDTNIFDYVNKKLEEMGL